MELPSFPALLAAAPELETQICLLALHAVLWWSFIKWASKAVVDPFVRPKAWKAQWLELQRAFFKKSFFTTFESDDDAFDFVCIFQAILVQHFVGGVLCLPSTLGFTGSSVSSLARHGALCEAGWELQDFITRAHQRFLQGEKGKRMQPVPLLVVVTIHHAMGTAMCIPMNLFYAENVSYHEFVCLLQLAAFVALGLQSYGYTLDVKKRSGLWQMKVTIAISWAMILYTRGLRFAILGQRLLISFASESHWRMLWVGCIVMLLMGVFNLMIFLDATAKLNKFATMALNSEASAKPRQHRGATSEAKSLLQCSSRRVRKYISK